MRCSLRNSRVGPEWSMRSKRTFRWSERRRLAAPKLTKEHSEALPLLKTRCGLTPTLIALRNLDEEEAM